MGTLAQDTFVRANQSGWGTASDSETWSTSGASSTQSINSNKGIIAATSGSDTHNQLGTQTVADQDIQCQITINDGNDVAGVEARFSPANGTTCYKLLYYANDLHLNKSFNGTTTTLQNYGGYSLTPGTSYQFRIQCDGSLIQAMWWPDSGTMPANWMLLATDFSIASGGFAVLAASSGGSGVQFSQFTASDVSSSDEMAISLAWLKSTLAGDAKLMSYAPGGMSRTFAQPGVVPPYVVVQHQPGGNDYLKFGGRAYSDIIFRAVAVGPTKNMQEIVNAAARIDVLLMKSEPVAVTDGTIISSFRQEPVSEDVLVDGETWNSMGGIYLVRAKAS